ncbi:hypothetical protein D9757_000463 [Collybiopsis confluens]|uniref:Trafficking protein particle complex subunit 11 domain-containing protein n=1 Tax=Collybiopsis confluens TaxID=2823264 RepID=A0A8H5I181_9AGAR|nr:hypothetical protein D9757_000463 [Collybiopsis confluens]
MNSYPLELLAQLAPVMFVAGLNPPASPPPPPTASNPGPTHPAPTHHSHHPSSSNNDPNLPTSRSHTSLPSNTHSATPSARPDPFTILFARLREVMLNQRKVTVWDPPTFPTNALDNDGRPVHEKKKIFQVVLVDKDIRFPPRKVDPEPASQADVPAAFSTGHSPLSPLTLTSPLHPDGLIAPIWIRKHTMLVPAVFVLFTRLFELDSTNTPASPPDALELERQQDTMLSSAIAQRKRTTNERGIKLTVVLLASRRMLDDPSLNLDARLTFIRRQSGLDSRAALFVLSPIAKDELSDFVKRYEANLFPQVYTRPKRHSLQTALWDPAVEYYTAHSKRVRQKRNRYQAQASQQTSHYNPISTLGPAPLSPKGWTVRYEYKMACFAEFRGEHEVALKHYQDAYTALTMMFLAPGSSLSAGAAISPGEKGLISATSTPSHLAAQFSLPPRTKRWAEAKVLADTINIKIIKLYLYNNETALALAQQRLHVRTFPTVAGFVGSPTAGEGKEGEEGSYEYWSWVSRMWSVLAEMLVEGSRTPGSDLIIPVHRPRLPLSGPGASSTTTGSIVGRKSTLAEGFLGGTGVGGINPSHALMHPGWYYLFAAECAEKKTARFIQGSRAREGEMSQEQRKTYLGSVKGLVGDVLEVSRSPRHWLWILI